MFAGMKPLPKALIIFLPIALAIGAYIKFAPEKKVVAPVAVEAPVVVTPVPSEAATAAKAQEAPSAPAPVAEPVEATGNVTSGDAGMKALLKAGKK